MPPNSSGARYQQVFERALELARTHGFSGRVMSVHNEGGHGTAAILRALGEAARDGVESRFSREWERQMEVGRRCGSILVKGSVLP
jgi:hypothetical protein